MSLDKKWATLEDFATLFQYFWYRDFPIDQAAIGAKRSDWTIHTGIVVHRIANLFGLVARFESGKRTDAILRSKDGDEIAIEWEWGGVLGKANELNKLKERDVRPKSKEGLKYAVLVTYTHTPNIEKVHGRVRDAWEEGDGARWPLLLILVDVTDVPKRTFTAGVEFGYMQMSVFENRKPRNDLRSVPAFPWKVPDTRLGLSWSNIG